MAHRVRIASSALADIESSFTFIEEESQSHNSAVAWYTGLIKAIESLSASPGRCPVIPEREHFEPELRHLLYGSHRIVFRVDDSRRVVTVVRVYHGSRRPLNW